MRTGARSCWRATAFRRRCGRFFAEPGFRRGRYRDAAGVAGQRGPSPRLRDRGAVGQLASAPALSPHLAGIRLQEAAGGRRDADFVLRPGLPQPRARPLASPGIHDARMVSRGRALRGADAAIAPRCWRSRPRRQGRRSSPIAAAKPIRFRNPSALRSPRPSTRLPASTCWRLSRRTARPTRRNSRLR